MRLNKYLARSGIASRRKCDKLIESGKVIINGCIEKNYSYQVLSNDVVICNGFIVDFSLVSKVYLVNKLKGYISTCSDPRGRKRVIDLIPTMERLFTVGRLDRDTTGAILVTNDGEIANILMHPRNQIERVYIISTKIDIPRSKYKLLMAGLTLDHNTTAYGQLHRLGRKSGLVYWEVVLREGKHHEVKRIFKALGSAVINLHRKSFAGIDINSILPGKFRELKKYEINKLLDLKKNRT